MFQFRHGGGGNFRGGGSSQTGNIIESHDGGNSSGRDIDMCCFRDEVVRNFDAIIRSGKDE